MGRQKVDLLKAEWKRGLPAVIRHIWRSGRDALYSKRNLVYHFDLHKQPLHEVTAEPGLSFRQITAWDQIAATDLDTLRQGLIELGWGEFDWLDKGYGLWIAEIDGRLAATLWWRSKEQAADFFIPVPDGTDLLWMIVVLPRFRGKRLYEIVLNSVMVYRATKGTEAFFISCRDYNLTSRRTFARMGWTYLGFAETVKRTDQTSWRPAPCPVPARVLEGMT